MMGGGWVRIAGGILCLVLGVSYPMAVLLWLNARMRRQPALSPRQVSAVLAFNGVFPLALVGLGLGLLSTRVRAIPAFWPALALVAVAAVVLLLRFWRLGPRPGAADPATKGLEPSGAPDEETGGNEGDNGRGITRAGV